MAKYSRQHVCEAITYWEKQLKELDEPEKKQIDESISEIFDVKKLIEKAKQAASKIKTAAQISSFLASNMDDIYELSKRLPEKCSKDLMGIVKCLETYSKSEAELDESIQEETQAKIISALVALVLFLLNAPKSWVVTAASPVIGPLVLQGVKLASRAVANLASKKK